MLSCNLLHQNEARQTSTEVTNHLIPPTTLSGHLGWLWNTIAYFCIMWHFTVVDGQQCWFSSPNNHFDSKPQACKMADGHAWLCCLLQSARYILPVPIQKQSLKCLLFSVALLVGVENFVLPLHGKYTCRLLYVRKKGIERWYNRCVIAQSKNWKIMVWSQEMYPDT